jgi:hypothetical protein
MTWIKVLKKQVKTKASQSTTRSASSESTAFAGNAPRRQETPKTCEGVTLAA